MRHEWTTHYLPSNQLDLKRDPGSTSVASICEGQVTVGAHYGGPSHHFNAGTVLQLVKELLDNYGDLKVFRRLDTAEPPTVEFHAEFYDTAAADVAVVAVNGFKIGVRTASGLIHWRTTCRLTICKGCTLTINHYGPDVVRLSPRQLPSQHTLWTRHPSSGMDSVFAEMSLGTRGSSYETIPYEMQAVPVYSRPSPTGRSFMPGEESFGYWSSPHVGFTAHGYPRRDFKPHPVLYGARHQNEAVVPFASWDILGPGAIGQERGQVFLPHFSNSTYSPQRRGPTKFGGRHTQDFASGHHNVVDVERIRRGLDVRTTVSFDSNPSTLTVFDGACRLCCEISQTRLIR